MNDQQLSEMKRAQKREYARMQRLSHGTPEQQEEARRIARQRLLRAGIIDESGQLSEHYR